MKVKPKPQKVVSVAGNVDLPEKELKRIAMLGINRQVYVEGPHSKTYEFPVMSVNGLEDATGTSSITLAKWVKKGMLPGPVLRRTDTPIGAFYHIAEAQFIAAMLAKHKADGFKYYREDHIDLRKKLSAGIATVRAGLFK